jgi:hypothetical protein
MTSGPIHKDREISGGFAATAALFPPVLVNHEKHGALLLNGACPPV